MAILAGMLDALEIVVSSHLAGQKRAVKIGDRLHVSPAMFDLMKHASKDELEHLLRSIGLIDLTESRFLLLEVPKRQ